MRRALLRPLSARAVRRSAALVLSATATAAAALGGTTPAAAAGPVTQYGKVVHVADGDTFDVDVQGDGTRTPVRVRMNGLNTMELTEYSYNPANWRGECHGVEAAKRLHTLIQGKTVKLTAQNADSMAGSRYRRTPWVSIDGAWRDVSQIMLSEGARTVPVEQDRVRPQPAARRGRAVRREQGAQPVGPRPLRSRPRAERRPAGQGAVGRAR